MPCLPLHRIAASCATCVITWRTLCFRSQNGGGQVMAPSMRGTRKHTGVDRSALRRTCCTSLEPFQTVFIDCAIQAGYSTRPSSWSNRSVQHNPVGSDRSVSMIDGRAGGAPLRAVIIVLSIKRSPIGNSIKMKIRNLEHRCRCWRSWSENDVVCMLMDLVQWIL